MTASDISLIDTHVHIVDFLQQGCEPHELLDCMDAVGIERAVVFGLPYKKKWSYLEPRQPSYYLDDEAECYPWTATDDAVAAWHQQAPEPERLAPTICGVEPTDLDAADRVDRLLSTGPFVGVGELLLRHGRLTPHLLGETARANHPAVRRIVEVCARHGVPLAVHNNAGSTGQGPTAYLTEIEELLAWGEDVDVVWCHAGVSGEQVSPPSDEIADLLARFPRLHIDLSWSATEDLATPDEVDGEWLELVAGHPERFVWGSDTVGHVDDLGIMAQTIRRFIGALPPAARPLVAAENARRIWFDR